MKKTLFYLFFLLTLSLWAQDIKFDVLSNGGGRISSVNSTSFTIGQPFVGSITNGNNSIRQGFQQPSFRLSLPGCMDTLACNYDTLATINDSSCVYPPNGTSVVTACDSYSWDGLFDVLYCFSRNYCSYLNIATRPPFIFQEVSCLLVQKGQY